MTDDYALTAETPEAEDYLRLRVAAGLTPKTPESATAGLPNTLFAVVVRRDGEAVVRALVEHLRATAPKGAYVSLIADGEAHRLYSQYGFELTAPRSVGMAFVI